MSKHTATAAEMELEEILDKAGPEMRDIAKAIYDVGVEAERKRTRQELLEWYGNSPQVISREDLLAALDRICPERT